MIKRTQANISKCIIHKVANKYNSGQNAFSEELVVFDEESYELLLPLLLKDFSSVSLSYRFNENDGLNELNKYVTEIFNNELNKYVTEIFNDESNKVFIDESKNIVNHLFEQSNYANIKTGDVLVVYFEGIEYKDVLTEAVGIFKIESKDHFFQTYLDHNSFDVLVQKGISTRKLDKGCLVLNSFDTEGMVVLSVDNNNYDAQYWIKNFLNVKYANDRNLHTQNYLALCKEFSEQIVKPEFGKQEQSTFLANTVDFFKEHESVNYHDFKENVFEEEKHKKLFENYKKHFEKLNDVLIMNNFDVSDAVLKKEKSKFKTDIKLDTNIQIKIDVDAPDASSEYLELGYDEEKKMKYYKVYFNAEK